MPILKLECPSSLGLVRTMWVVPRVDTRIAELMEILIMLVVTMVTMWLLVLRLAVPFHTLCSIGNGVHRAPILLVAEFGLVLWLRGLSIREYLARRDPASGTFYDGMLAVFALCGFWWQDDEEFWVNNRLC